MRKTFSLKTNILAIFFFIFLLKINAQPNVLFIAIDDLRPELNCYGAPVYSPNIDKLAKEGVLFEHHYVQMAVCIPSRAALLTGLRSERTHQVYGPTVWDKVPGVKTWGNTFREAGYNTASLGKIWHTIGNNPDKFDIKWAPSWLEYTYAEPEAKQRWLNFRKLKANKTPDSEIKDLPFITECANVHDTMYKDGLVARRALRVMEKFANSDKPFMLAVGFTKPHLPFNAPKKYWELYNEEDIELAENKDFPKNMPDVAFSNHPNFYSYNYGEYEGLKNGQMMDNATAKHLRHAYRAATSYIDAQVGIVLNHLEKLGLAKNTIVVLWGDHGFLLGESGHWSKHSNFEQAAHAPLIFRVPWLKTKNIKTKALVETVDIFPTLLEYCGIQELNVCDGLSMVPLLENPEQEWKEAAFHCFNRHRTIDGERTLIIGHAVRTKRYRYVSWRKGWGMKGEEIASELYDYEKDPNETINHTGNKYYSKIKIELENLLVNGPAGRFN